jgi:hypothetical protein
MMINHETQRKRPPILYRMSVATGLATVACCAIECCLDMAVQGRGTVRKKLCEESENDSVEMLACILP